MARILIIEDDEIMARLYNKVFNFEGYQVELAPNGRAGLDKAREAQPDLIMLDVMMPELNGLETLDKLKADPTLKAIPVVMLTNLAGQQDAENAIAKGAVKYIIKSEQDPRGVVKLVSDLLGHNASSPSTPASPDQPGTVPPAQA